MLCEPNFYIQKLLLLPDLNSSHSIILPPDSSTTDTRRLGQNSKGTLGHKGLGNPHCSGKQLQEEGL